MSGAQMVVGINFMYSSTMFISISLNTMSKVQTGKKQTKKSDTMQQGMYRVARLLFISSCGMLACVALIAVAPFSGSAIYGFYTPTGFALYWGAFSLNLLVPSVAQVLLSADRKQFKKKKRKKSIAPASTAVSLSVGSSLVGSSVAGGSTAATSGHSSTDGSMGTSMVSSTGRSTATTTGPSSMASSSS